jgi:hypothetical protein
LAGFWWVRALVKEHNPIFPAGVGSVLPKGISPFNTYSTTLLSHFLAGRTAPLRTASHYARTLVGPALAVVAIGLVAPLVLGLVRRTTPLFLVGGLSIAFVLAYAITPYTGGGPTGVSFLIASQLRYALPALLLAGVAAAAALPRVTAGVAAIAIAWDAWKDFKAPGFRTDIHPQAIDVVIALVLTGAVLGALTATLRKVAPAVLAAGAGVLGLLFGAAIYGQTPVDAAQRLDAALGAREPVLVVSQTDLRSLMGQSLRRRIVTPVDAGHPHDSPHLSSADLAAAVARVRPAAVIVPVTPSPIVDANFVPTGYVKVGVINGDTIYVK